MGLALFIQLNTGLPFQLPYLNIRCKNTELIGLYVCSRRGARLNCKNLRPHIDVHTKQNIIKMQLVPDRCETASFFISV